MGLLERWDARNQEVLERQNRKSIEWWARATERKPPRWLLVLGWLYIGGGVIGMLAGIATRDVGRVAMGAVDALLWGMPLALLYYTRRHRW